ncbi:MAG: GNAT family N-acetyltransferase [Deltaproteobacteria bacterium]|nr:GNAT family N-acetyltransferase [Deltaproteobacteria bacterium]
MLFDALAAARLYRYLPERAPDSPEALARRFAALVRGAPTDVAQLWLNWAVACRDPEQWIGTLQATVLPDRAGNGAYALIGYALTPAVWGRGLGTEAVRWLVDELARRFALDRLVATVDVRDQASGRLLERVGFVRIGAEAAELLGEISTDFRYQLTY